jgi:tRNA-dihydrouridine synthase B
MCSIISKSVKFNMIYKGFWETIKKPVVGLAPMDGVTDAAMRFITKKYGGPDVVFTEFVSAEGIRAGATKLMRDFKYDDSERPIVAQLFGKDPDAFYLSTLVVCALGFDGVDVNMGCPARKVANRGEGAGLIKTPGLALEILKEVKRAVKDWSEGVSLEEAGVDEKILEYIKVTKVKRVKIPVSVKTRIGYDRAVTEEWMKTLLSVEPAVISLHGRTLKQGYSGLADWSEIGKAAKLCSFSKTLFLGNGDVGSVEDGEEKIKKYGGDGFLVGRASFGNPWVFLKEKEGVEVEKKLEIALEHARKFEELYPDDRFFAMRKHLSWYAKGFDGASDLRKRLVLCNTSEEVKQAIDGYLGKKGSSF